MNNDWDDNYFPLAYLITIRCYGTWLHGDKRGSVDRHGGNIYGTPTLPPNPKLESLMRQRLKHKPVILTQGQRSAIEGAIQEVCVNRGYQLHALNAGTNHVHSVVSAQLKPNRIVSAFKSYATRNLRENGLIAAHIKPWVRRKSARYLWKPQSVARAIEYVLYLQGDIHAITEFEDDEP